MEKNLLQGIVSLKLGFVKEIWCLKFQFWYKKTVPGIGIWIDSHGGMKPSDGASKNVQNSESE